MDKRRRVVLVLTLLLAGCGGTSVSEDLSPQAVQGQEVARSTGCTACHGDLGEGGVGPAWIGLAGSEVELEDGSTVVADADYLRRSITEPESQVVSGYTITMPTTKLSDPEVAALIAYIQELQ
jgi:cytochrome c oxidase subunit 2